MGRYNGAEGAENRKIGELRFDINFFRMQMKFGIKINTLSWIVIIQIYRSNLRLGNQSNNPSISNHQVPRPAIR